MTKMGPKQRFKAAVSETITRDGIDNLMEWLESETDFFTSPASTRHHGSYEGGLVEHSLNVFNQLLWELDNFVGQGWQEFISMETAAIIALFHDICKVNNYRLVEKWRKDADGQWESYEAYEYDKDALQMGHGAKSVFFLQRFIHLTVVEAQAIFWHMGAYDISPYASLNGLSSAFETNQLAFLIHRADMAATYAVENENFIYGEGEAEEVADVEDVVEEVEEPEVVEEEPKAETKITRRKAAKPKPEPKEEEVEEVEQEQEKPAKSKIRMPKKMTPKPEPELEEAEEEAEDNVVAEAGKNVNERYYFYSDEAGAYYWKEENEPDNDSDVLVDEQEYLDAMCPELEEDFFYVLDGKPGKLAKGERLPEEYDEETWEPITEQEYIKLTEKPKAVAKPTRKKPTPSRRPRP
nr:MAG TPA: Putative helicase [Caudoviricetes sp.]